MFDKMQYHEVGHTCRLQEEEVGPVNSDTTVGYRVNSINYWPTELDCLKENEVNQLASERVS